MSADTDFERPYFFEALKEWTQLLSEHGLPSKILWVLDENLVFETDPSRPNGVRLSYQTRFTATPPELAERTYAFFSDVEARMVFYCLGTSNGDDWLISFHPGPGTEIEEITDEQRWKDRVLRGRPLSDLDFCMPLDVLRELDAHGRPLSEYERFGMKVLGAYQRWSKSGR
jgi:hypothetical protein